LFHSLLAARRLEDQSLEVGAAADDGCDVGMGEEPHPLYEVVELLACQAADDG
jgi:hypothetical protein